MRKYALFFNETKVRYFSERQANILRISVCFTTIFVIHLAYLTAHTLTENKKGIPQG